MEAVKRGLPAKEVVTVAIAALEVSMLKCYLSCLLLKL